MKTYNATLWTLLLGAVLTFSACSSDDDINPQTTTQTNPTPTAPDDANAVLAAIMSYSDLPSNVPSVPGVGGIAIDVASGSFFNGGVGSALVNVGDVMLNSKALQIPRGNAYINNPMELSYSLAAGQSNSWQVSGGSGFDAFSHTTTKRMPSQVKFTASVGDSFSKGSDLTLTIESVTSNTDNILWVVSDGSTTVTKESKTTSVTFSASDLSGMRATSTGLVQVASYNTEEKTFGGKKVYFINETVHTKLVEVN
ncbi:hypothetical protein SAMN04489724_3143 [Algoriphagus locisalis]|uniref:Uncharacterized protein n=1 Tax=Algoriphagus locisalis TaxID=305507 RepID=A0A1I7CFH8_9BACT|nr:hypothetical protein [Algoriphagus locisalis]SFT98176.1 hypothetical protein SAMN04489724_3143 [Algoriphagus locisalis]